MNENMNKPAGTKDKRRYKYGSLSVAFTLVFIALIIVLNLVFSSLSLSGDLTVDLTQEEFATIGEESVSLLSDLGKDLHTTIYFMASRDRFDAGDNQISGINMTALCRDLAENYADIFNGSGDKGVIRVEYKELDTDPEFERKYLEESGTALSETTVIIQGKYHYRILSLTNFFTFDEKGNPTAFSGEYRLTGAIVRSSIEERQVVTLTYGHGEDINSDGTVSATSAIYGLVSVLDGAGFEVKTADLHRDEIDERTKILITYGPESDFDDIEIDKITKYVDDRNAFMAFVDSSTPALTNLQGFLNDYWGINYKPGYGIADSSNSVQVYEAILADTPAVDSDMQNSSAAYQIHKTVTDMGGSIATILPNSVELTVRDGITKDGFTVETVLSSFDTAFSSNNGVMGTEGQMPLMLVSTKQGFGENEVNEFSYVMLVGSTEFAKTSALSGDKYGNKRIVLAAARIFSSENYAPDIMPKDFVSTALTIDNGTARALTWIICTVIPGIIMILGFVMFFKRRHL